MAGFWGHRTDTTPEVYAKIKAAAKRDLAEFHEEFKGNPLAKRGFWEYILDIEDFKKWKNDCKKMLFREAWFDGFMTLIDHPKAIGLVFAATSFTLFAMSIFVGTSASIYACFMLTSMICTASYLANIFLEEDNTPDVPTPGNAVSADGGALVATGI